MQRTRSGEKASWTSGPAIEELGIRPCLARTPDDFVSPRPSCASFLTTGPHPQNSISVDLCRSPDMPRGAT